MTLIKSPIIETITKQSGFIRKKTTETVQTTLVLNKPNIMSGEDVLISGFGKICFKEKRERRGRNPATGEDMMVAPRRVVTINCSGKLRNKVNGER